ncbi:unnamed protein product [Discosporangium mesarthrocarpum]
MERKKEGVGVRGQGGAEQDGGQKEGTEGSADGEAKGREAARGEDSGTSVSQPGSRQEGQRMPTTAPPGAGNAESTKRLEAAAGAAASIGVEGALVTGGSIGGPSSDVGSMYRPMAVESQEEEGKEDTDGDGNKDPAILLQGLWMPKKMSSPDFMRNICRVRLKFTQMDDMAEICNILQTKSSPFPPEELRPPVEGWTGEHDLWLLESVWTCGWFTALQKKRAARIIADGNGKWPGGFPIPNQPALLFKRLKSCLTTYRKVLKAREKAETKARERAEIRAREMREREAATAALVEQAKKRKAQVEAEAKAREAEWALKRAAQAVSASTTPHQPASMAGHLGGGRLYSPPMAAAYSPPAREPRPTPHWSVNHGVTGGWLGGGRDGGDQAGPGPSAMGNQFPAQNDGIERGMIRHAMKDLGVPVHCLKDSRNHSPSPLRDLLGLSWDDLGKLAFVKAHTEQMGMDILEKAAADAGCGDQGFRLSRLVPPSTNVPKVSRDANMKWLQGVKKITQVRAILMVHKELSQLQAFTARVTRPKSMKKQNMPSWWKTEVHDVILLTAACMHGPSRMEKVIDDTTLASLFPQPGREGLTNCPDEKENSKEETSKATGTTEPGKREGTEDRAIAVDGPLPPAPDADKAASNPFLYPLSRLGLSVETARSRLTFLHKEILVPVRTDLNGGGTGTGGEVGESSSSTFPASHPNHPAAPVGGVGSSSQQLSPAPSASLPSRGGGPGAVAGEWSRGDAKRAATPGFFSGEGTGEGLQSRPVHDEGYGGLVPRAVAVVPQVVSTPKKLKTSHPQEGSVIVDLSTGGPPTVRPCTSMLNSEGSSPALGGGQSSSNKRQKVTPPGSGKPAMKTLQSFWSK